MGGSFTRSDHMLLEYCEKIIAATAAEEVWSTHVEVMAGFGFDRLLYGFTRFRSSRGFGHPDDLLFMTNHSPDYVDGYLQEHLHDAPMLRWISENVGPCSWRWVAENLDALSERERRVLKFNKRHGVVAGYTITFPDVVQCNKGAIALTARPGLSQDDVDAIWADQGQLIAAMNGVMHHKLIHLPYNGSGRDLTRRQRQVLEWVRDGRTTLEIAEILGVSTATVEKHLRLARDALHARTTAQAVAKASLKNQIFLI